MQNRRSKEVHNIVIGNESWIYVRGPEIKQQSTLWALQDEPIQTIDFFCHGSDAVNVDDVLFQQDAVTCYKAFKITLLI